MEIDRNRLASIGKSSNNNSISKNQFQFMANDEFHVWHMLYKPISNDLKVLTDWKQMQSTRLCACVCACVYGPNDSNAMLIDFMGWWHKMNPSWIFISSKHDTYKTNLQRVCISNRTKQTKSTYSKWTNKLNQLEMVKKAN